MDFSRLGQTDIQVSKICLGSMTWGEQNTLEQAHEQLDYAFSRGVNFIDTAEMYPVPPKAQTYARTEEIIGAWLVGRKREEVILASKVAGPERQSGSMQYIRGGTRLSAKQIIEACEASLRRLKTDYLDLYQLHWPERAVNFFGRLGMSALADREDCVALEESVQALSLLQEQGKIRYFGLSNETPWGVMHCLALAREKGMARVQSVQNPYSLLNRSYEVGLSEVGLREKVGLLAYSPLAFGVLTGKYRKKPWPEEGRLTLYSRFSRYTNKQAFLAVERYAEIAQQAGLSLTTLALAFVNQRDFVCSNIIGATTMAQLKENIDSVTVRLSEQTLEAIDAVHAEISNPCP